MQAQAEKIAIDTIQTKIQLLRENANVYRSVPWGTMIQQDAGCIDQQDDGDRRGGEYAVREAYLFCVRHSIPAQQLVRLRTISATNYDYKYNLRRYSIMSLQYF
jgi:hypothetical protein